MENDNYIWKNLYEFNFHIMGFLSSAEYISCVSYPSEMVLYSKQSFGNPIIGQVPRITMDDVFIKIKSKT